ncbi:hypothetical protein GCM10025862_18430 [Arsenicicoccus piscis]|uniref:Uncharacterized protein n=1 Tax=Arsenicicoccus piscis TaxID=673954 RepID=A0ABQ6HNU0_9MICO|nr:hypothetical protein GCM10025862_18430 [Arsenicicoccus piscis]
MPVGEQHRGRLEPMLAQRRLQLVEHPDAGVDHEALLAGSGRDDVAVRRERQGWESDEEHAAKPSEWQ